jgi:CMP-N,N'-diacetyllegionaminic acid synthase
MADIVALIPARGGSKSIPRKNVKLLAGRPLISWTIESALASRHLSQVIVSTDDQEIADVSRKYGAQVPFLRPAGLAKDDSSSLSVALHLIEWFRSSEMAAPQYILLLQPTSPFRTVEDIDSVISIAQSTNAAVVSVRAVESHPFLCKQLNKNGALEDFVSTDIGYLRRQDLPEVYSLNGAIYLNQCTSLVQDQTFVPSGSLPYIMPAERSLDVDTPWDWHIAELILRDRHENRTSSHR